MSEQFSIRLERKIFQLLLIAYFMYAVRMLLINEETVKIVSFLFFFLLK